MIDTLIQKNPLLKNAITFEREKFGDQESVDENYVTKYIEPEVPNREKVKLIKCGVVQKKNRKTLSQFWNRMKDPAT